jgi:hypothetical protein
MFLLQCINGNQSCPTNIIRLYQTLWDVWTVEDFLRQWKGSEELYYSPCYTSSFNRTYEYVLFSYDNMTKYKILFISTWIYPQPDVIRVMDQNSHVQFTKSIYSLETQRFTCLQKTSLRLLSSPYLTQFPDINAESWTARDENEYKLFLTIPSTRANSLDLIERYLRSGFSVDGYRRMFFPAAFYIATATDMVYDLAVLIEKSSGQSSCISRL